MTGNNGGKIVIVHSLPTHLDERADLHIGSEIDEVMKGLMKRMDIEIP